MLISRIDPPKIEDDVFTKIAQDKAEFANFVRCSYSYISSLYSGETQCDQSRLEDAHIGYEKDKQCASNDSSKGSQPDHFRLTGILVFWLHRFSPVSNFREITHGEISYLSENERKEWEVKRRFVKDYHSEFLAFELGLMLCDTFQNETKNHTQKSSPKIELSDYERICASMKYTSIPPQALELIYKSLHIPLQERS